MTATPGAPHPEADLARLIRCMGESEKDELLLAAVTILGKRCSLDPLHSLNSPEGTREEVEHEELDERIFRAWPGDWPGRELVELDNLGDAGAWLSAHLADCDDLIFGSRDFAPIAASMAQEYLSDIRAEGYPLPSDFDGVPREGLWTPEEEVQVAQDFVYFFWHWRDRVIHALERQNGQELDRSAPALEEPLLMERHVALLAKARSQPHVPGRVEELLDHLAIVSDPFLTLASVSVLVRDRFEGAEPDDCAERDLADPAWIFSVSPFTHSFGWLHLNLPPAEALESAWDDIEAAATLCVAVYKRGLPGASSLAQDGEIGAAFWSSAFADSSNRKVARSAFLAGIGKDIRFLDFRAVEEMRALAEQDGNSEHIHFIWSRLSLGLHWLARHLSREQICGFPALVDLCAQVLVQESLEDRDGEVVYLRDGVFPGVASTFLAADLEAGLRAVCRVYEQSGQECEFLSDTLHALHPHSADDVIVVLRRLALDSEDNECRAGATSLLADYFADEETE